MPACMDKDCGDESKRRLRCQHCKLLVCGWCWHHVHQCWPGHKPKECRDSKVVIHGNYGGRMKFRKKPVVIEAFQMTAARREDNVDWPEWLNRAWNTPFEEIGSFFPLASALVIHTMEGSHIVSVDDWIIQGVKGELYSCKPDIFEMTYEPA